MAKKVQSQEMKDAYGQRFSQQDLTVKEENMVPQPLETSTSKKGGVELLARLARGRRITFSKKERNR